MNSDRVATFFSIVSNSVSSSSAKCFFPFSFVIFPTFSHISRFSGLGIYFAYIPTLSTSTTISTLLFALLFLSFFSSFATLVANVHVSINAVKNDENSTKEGKAITIVATYIQIDIHTQGSQKYLDCLDYSIRKCESQCVSVFFLCLFVRSFVL